MRALALGIALFLTACGCRESGSPPPARPAVRMEDFHERLARAKERRAAELQRMRSDAGVAPAGP